MKMPLPSKAGCHRNRAHERGTAVIVVIAILAILLIYIGGNLRTLHLLGRDLKQVEERQIRRFSIPTVTNAPPITNSPAVKTQ